MEIATLDEFEEVSGKGAAQLEGKGIHVRVGCCEGQARRLNGEYFKLQAKQQPTPQQTPTTIDTTKAVAPDQMPF